MRRWFNDPRIGGQDDEGDYMEASLWGGSSLILKSRVDEHRFLGGSLQGSGTGGCCIRGLQ